MTASRKERRGWWSVLLRRVLAHSVLLHTVLMGFAVQGLQMVSSILAARILGPEDRGHLALLVMVPMILVQVGGLGLPVAITYFIARERARAADVVSSLAGLALIQVVVLCGISSAVMPTLLAGGAGDVRRATFVMLAVIPAILAQQYARAILQGQHKFRVFNAFRAIPVALYGLGILAIFLLDTGDLWTVTLTYTGTNLLAGIVMLIAALRSLPRPTHGDAIPRLALVRYGVKSLLGSFSAVEGLRLDQAVVGLFLSPVALGSYVAAMAFTTLPGLIAKSVSVVAYPQIASQVDPRAARRALWHYFWISSAGTLIVIVALEAAAGWLVPFLFGGAFSEAVPITRILLVSALLYNARRVLTAGLRGEGRPGIGSTAEAVSWLTLLPAIALLTPLWDLEGVALALVLSSAVSLATLLWLTFSSSPGRQRDHLPKEEARIAA